MAYNKTTWATGDVVTATKLNNMENGIENAVPFDKQGAINTANIYFDENLDDYTISKTYEQIYYEWDNEGIVVFDWDGSSLQIYPNEVFGLEGVDETTLVFVRDIFPYSISMSGALKLYLKVCGYTYTSDNEFSSFDTACVITYTNG